MPPETQTAERIAFGSFELETASGELFRNGRRIRLSGQPADLLVILVRRSGQLVTREELRLALWPEDTFVDFDHGLNNCIRRIRDALGDPSDSPRFIETLPKKGYRFIAKTRTISPQQNGSVSPVPQSAVLAPETINAGAPLKRDPSQVSVSDKLADARGRGRFRSGLAGAVVLIVGLATAIWYLRRPLPPLRVTEYTQITHDGRPKNLVGTDGSRIYLNRDFDPPHTAQVAISGGEIAPVPVALPLASIKDVSPDGSALLVDSFEGGQGSLWTVQVPGGSLRRLLTIWEQSPAWSPDGKSLAYSMNGDLYIMQSDGTGNRKLAAVGGTPVALSWSPDGSKIRFSKDNRLWEMSSDGTGLHPLLPGWRPSFSQCCGRWTSEGRFFVFVTRDAFTNYSDVLPASQLWVLDERRGLFRRTPAVPAQLTSGPIRWNTPISSKDGTKIFAQGVILRGELDRYDAQSSRLQPYLGGISAEFITFSPDGEYVAYVTFPEGILWRANRDGSHPVQLTDPSLYPLNPRWSPDGSQILFCSNRGSEHVRAYVVSSQGGTPQAILPEDSGGQSDPSWSADGHKIVFSTLEAVGNFNTVLRILDLDSHQITTLPGSEGMWSPRWSPNGRFIAGLHGGPTGGIKIFDFETQRWSVVQQTHYAGYPTWSSNSQFIYCLRAWEDDPAVYRVRVSDGAEERVVDLNGFSHTGAFTHWMGLDPTDTPMLLRDVGTDDIYALTVGQK